MAQFIERAEHQGCVYIGDARLEKSFITWLDDSIVDNIKVLSNNDYKQRSNTTILFTIHNSAWPY